MRFPSTLVALLGTGSFLNADGFQLTSPSSHQRRNKRFTSTSRNLSLDQIIEALPTDVNAAFNQLPAATDLDLASLHTSPVLPLLAIFTTLYSLSKPPTGYISGNEPYLRGQYDPTLARQFYSRKPLLVLRRSLQLFRLSNKFLFNILFDKYILRDQVSCALYVVCGNEHYFLH